MFYAALHSSLLVAARVCRAPGLPRRTGLPTHKEGTLSTQPRRHLRSTCSTERRCGAARACVCRPGGHGRRALWPSTAARAAGPHPQTRAARPRRAACERCAQSCAFMAGRSLSQSAARGRALTRAVHRRGKGQGDAAVYTDCSARGCARAWRGAVLYQGSTLTAHVVCACVCVCACV